MPIQFQCASCSSKLSVADEHAGKKSRCPKCKNVLTIPSIGPTEVDKVAKSEPAVPEAPSPASSLVSEKSPREAEATLGSPEGFNRASSVEAQWFRIQRMGKISVVYLNIPRSIELSQIRNIKDKLMQIISNETKPEVLLDLSEINYLPSALIGTLAALHLAALKYRGSFRICSPTRQILEIFQVVGLDKKLDIFPGLESALTSFRRDFHHF